MLSGPMSSGRTVPSSRMRCRSLFDQDVLLAVHEQIAVTVEARDGHGELGDQLAGAFDLTAAREFVVEIDAGGIHRAVAVDQ